MYLLFICLCCVTTSTFAAPPTNEVPQERQPPTVIPIVSLSAEYESDGKFKYSYETGNGIKREETAYDKELPEGKSHSDNSNEGGEDDDSEIHVQEGSYSYTAPDGTVVSVRYIADENGFQPINEHIHFGAQAPKTSEKVTNDTNSPSTISNNEKLQLALEPEKKLPLKFGDRLVNKNQKLSKKGEDFDKQNNVPKESKINEGHDNASNKPILLPRIKETVEKGYVKQANKNNNTTENENAETANQVNHTIKKDKKPETEKKSAKEEPTEIENRFATNDLNPDIIEPNTTKGAKNNKNETEKKLYIDNAKLKTVSKSETQANKKKSLENQEKLAQVDKKPEEIEPDLNGNSTKNYKNPSKDNATTDQFIKPVNDDVNNPLENKDNLAKTNNKSIKEENENDEKSKHHAATDKEKKPALNNDNSATINDTSKYEDKYTAQKKNEDQNNLISNVTTNGKTSLEENRSVNRSANPSNENNPSEDKNNFTIPDSNLDRKENSPKGNLTKAEMKPIEKELSGIVSTQLPKENNYSKEENKLANKDNPPAKEENVTALNYNSTKNAKNLIEEKKPVNESNKLTEKNNSPNDKYKLPNTNVTLVKDAKPTSDSNNNEDYSEDNDGTKTNESNQQVKEDNSLENKDKNIKTEKKPDKELKKTDSIDNGTKVDEKPFKSIVKPNMNEKLKTNNESALKGNSSKKYQPANEEGSEKPVKKNNLTDNKDILKPVKEENGTEKPVNESKIPAKEMSPSENENNLAKNTPNNEPNQSYVKSNFTDNDEKLSTDNAEPHAKEKLVNRNRTMGKEKNPLKGNAKPTKTNEYSAEEPNQKDLKNNSTKNDEKFSKDNEAPNIDETPENKTLKSARENSHTEDEDKLANIDETKPVKNENESEKSVDESKIQAKENNPLENSDEFMKTDKKSVKETDQPDLKNNTTKSNSIISKDNKTPDMEENPESRNAPAQKNNPLDEEDKRAKTEVKPVIEENEKHPTENYPSEHNDKTDGTPIKESNQPNSKLNSITNDGQISKGIINPDEEEKPTGKHDKEYNPSEDKDKLTKTGKQLLKGENQPVLRSNSTKTDKNYLKNNTSESGKYRNLNKSSDGEVEGEGETDPEEKDLKPNLKQISIKNDTEPLNPESNSTKEESEKPTAEPEGSSKSTIKDVQKPLKDVEKHEKVAEHAAKQAAEAAGVAENAADAAKKAAKETEKFAQAAQEPGNQNRTIALQAAKEHAKLAGEAAKEAVQAAETAENAAEDAKKAAKAADKVVQLVQSTSNDENVKKLAENKSAKIALNASLDGKKEIDESKSISNKTESNNEKAPSRAEKDSKNPKILGVL